MNSVDQALSAALQARKTGDLARAEAIYQDILKDSPGHLKARSGLSRVFIAQERWAEAEQAASAVLASNKTHLEGRYTFASARLEQGFAEEAESLLSQLIGEGKTQSVIYFVRGRARLELGDIDGGLADSLAAYQGGPSDLSLRQLGGVLWMLGRTHEFETLINQSPDPLKPAAMDMLRQAGQPDKALALWQSLPEPIRQSAQAMLIKSVIHQDKGEGLAALQAADAALRQSPKDAAAIDAYITACLMCGETGHALEWLAAAERDHPALNAMWQCHRLTALRLSGDDAYKNLAGYEDFIRAYQILTPEGFASLSDFNQAFAASLEDKRRYATHPLNQSLRLGVQTSRDLRNMGDPVIDAYVSTLDAPIREYLKDIGSSASHPFTARNTGDYAFSGMWSVRLDGGGRHVNHIHPQGWVSSAYYVSVPEETLQSESRAGWIKFGEPPFKTIPPIGPEKWIQPKAGLLVLFPSHMWHGTEPIYDGSTRVTAPFDLVPA